MFEMPIGVLGRPNPVMPEMLLFLWRTGGTGGAFSSIVPSELPPLPSDLELACGRRGFPELLGPSAGGDGSWVDF